MTVMHQWLCGDKVIDQVIQCTIIERMFLNGTRRSSLLIPVGSPSIAEDYALNSSDCNAGLKLLWLLTCHVALFVCILCVLKKGLLEVLDGSVHINSHLNSAWVRCMKERRFILMLLYLLNGTRSPWSSSLHLVVSRKWLLLDLMELLISDRRLINVVIHKNAFLSEPQVTTFVKKQQLHTYFRKPNISDREWRTLVIPQENGCDVIIIST